MSTLRISLVVGTLVFAQVLLRTAAAQDQEYPLAAPKARLAATDVTGRQPIEFHVQSASERLEMVINSSRIVTLDRDIPRAQVGNRDVLTLTPLGPRQVQVHAKKPGVTEVNLWDDQGEVHSIDVIVYGDARALHEKLRAQFPMATIRVSPTSNGVILDGYIDRPDYVPTVMQIAQEYYPRVINNMRVAGAQQVLLHVKVAEVNRTKLRDMGMDWTAISGSDFFASSVSGLIASVAAGAVTTTGAETMTFGIVDGSNSFFGVLTALQRNQLMSIMAEPTLVTVSGRPAYFQSGGEIPILVPQSLGTVSIEYHRYGTQVDFVPIVLGNGNVRLEVRPRVTEIDNATSVSIGGTSVPGFRTREVETGVEMKFGQTLALAGLIQKRVDATKRGVPWVMDIPYFGFPFRRVVRTENEIELLIMVRPELAEPIDADQPIPCAPGETSGDPRDWDLYMRGHMEVPKCQTDCTLDSGDLGPWGARGEDVPAGQPAPAASAPAAQTRRSSETRVSQQSRGAAPATKAAVAGRQTSGTAQGGAKTAGGVNPQDSSKPQSRSTRQQPAAGGGEPGFLGDVGYDSAR